LFLETRMPQAGFEPTSSPVPDFSREGDMIVPAGNPGNPWISTGPDYTIGAYSVNKNCYIKKLTINSV